MPVHSTRTLPNGLKAVAVELPHLHCVELALYIRVGGQNDPPGKEGLSHFLEHMLFRGTREFPTSLAIETAFEAIGGSINASTDEECTCIFTRLHPDFLSRGIEILASMVLQPTLSGMDLEKRIIAEEALDDLNDRNEEINPHNLASKMLWPDHPLGQPTIGTLESIASFDRDDLVRHMERFYRPGNALLVAAGRVDARELFHAAGQHLSIWEPAPTPVMPPPREKQSEPQSLFVADADSQAHLHLAFRAISRHDPGLPALRLIRRILCGSGSSRLHLNLREQHGIVYSVDASLAAYQDTGYFSIELSTAPENLHRAVAECLKELLRLVTQPVPDDELDRVRQSYFYELDYSRDSGYDMQVRFGWGDLMGQVHRIEEDRASATRVRPVDLKDAARGLFRPANLNLVVVGAWTPRQQEQVLAELAAYQQGWQGLPWAPPSP
jgi:predicted Zn-dependent peptidase